MIEQLFSSNPGKAAVKREQELIADIKAVKKRLDNLGELTEENYQKAKFLNAALQDAKDNLKRFQRENIALLEMGYYL